MLWRKRWVCRRRIGARMLFRLARRRIRRLRRLWRVMRRREMGGRGRAVVGGEIVAGTATASGVTGMMSDQRGGDTGPGHARGTGRGGTGIAQDRGRESAGGIGHVAVRGGGTMTDVGGGATTTNAQEAAIETTSIGRATETVVGADHLVDGMTEGVTERSTYVFGRMPTRCAFENTTLAYRSKHLILIQASLPPHRTKKVWARSPWHCNHSCGSSLSESVCGFFVRAAG